MIYFFTIANYCRENKRSMFLFLLLFHIVISVTLFSIANTEYLSSLHNGEGLWNFTRDSTYYHKEVLNLVTYIEKSQWFAWWYSYLNHSHLKVASLIYWITGYHSPIVFEIVNCVVWATSLLLIFRVSELLFPDDIKLPLIVSIFFLQPSILISSTQLLRDPIYILGFCFMCYGFTIFAKQNSKWKWVFILQIGIILVVLMRDYVSIILLVFLILFSVIVYFKEKTFLAPLLVLIIPLILLEFFSVNRFISTDKAQMERRNLMKQVQASIAIDEQPQVSVTIEEQPQVSLTREEKNKADNIAIKEKIKSDTVAIQFPTQSYITSQVTILEVLNTISDGINTIRYSFRKDNSYAGSRIDPNKKYQSFTELVLYFPRTLQIGFLSPFPSNWFKKGEEVGTIGNLLAGLEMVIWYFALLGFIYIMYKNPSVIKPLSVVFLFSTTLIILMVYVVPNIGAIYRMRQAYMIPFFLYGARGLSLMVSNFNKKTT